MRTLITNGMICDGSGKPACRLDLLIEGDRICAIGKNMEASAKKIDAGGKVVAPGFIDMHRHCDIAALTDEDFGTIELRQGITSAVGGNCGLGIFPIRGEHREEIYSFVEPCLGTMPENLEFPSYAAYRAQLEKKCVPIHLGSLVGTGAVKASVKGYRAEPFTRGELERAEGYIREALEEGALGVSMGIMYQPECYSSREEMLYMLKAAAPFQRPLMCHIRGEGDLLVSSVKEIAELCREAEMPLNISHLKATGRRNWNRTILKAIEVIEEARAAGQDVTADFYPYCCGSTTLFSLLPPALMCGGLEETLHKIHGKRGRDLLKKQLYAKNEGWENMAEAIGWERIVISSVAGENNRGLQGLDFQTAAEKGGYEDPAELMADLLYEEKGKVGIILQSMEQADVDRVAKLPYTMLISDALYGGGDCPHPRLCGAFPRLLREFVRERRVLTLEEAIRKMTAMPAQRLGLKDRGSIAVGNYADLVIFDPQEIRDRATYDDPKQPGEGIAAVFVDGRQVVEKDRRIDGSRIKSGKML